MKKVYSSHGEFTLKPSGAVESLKQYKSGEDMSFIVGFDLAEWREYHAQHEPYDVEPDEIDICDIGYWYDVDAADIDLAAVMQRKAIDEALLRDLAGRNFSQPLGYEPPVDDFRENGRIEYHRDDEPDGNTCKREGCNEPTRGGMLYCSKDCSIFRDQPVRVRVAPRFNPSREREMQLLAFVQEIAALESDTDHIPHSYDDDGDCEYCGMDKHYEGDCELSEDYVFDSRREIIAKARSIAHPCPQCNGTGIGAPEEYEDGDLVKNAESCDACNGTGTTR